MANNPKKRKKVSFGQRRYPTKISETEEAKMMLPDEVFWPAYYGRYRGGIYAQVIQRLRWHVIECLEDGFKDDDIGLLHTRKGLVGLGHMSDAFLEKHQVVLDSPTFQQKIEWMDEKRKARRSEPRPPTSEWKERAGLADREFKEYLSDRMEGFRKAMELSSPLDAEKKAWNALLRGYLYNSEIWLSRNQGQLQKLDFNDALALVDERTESEISELIPLERHVNKPEGAKMLHECKEIFLERLARERAAYVKQLTDDDMKHQEKEHTNFGLDIDVPSLPDRLKKYTFA